ncbi:hypothetical protein NQ314_019597 [Rhamnusium bicolor]|uniref:Transcription initiation factor TFIID subunit 4 n=1 Tax=Rhamnusium bicolor TaxID=1586634 RepID=A0AAV8WNM8_9CUCU|nr:hypothetical protein NQ314_019597 [Rhamnusium bicolor]
MNLQELNTQLGQQQPQTITLTSVNSGNYANFTTVPVKQQVVNQRILSNSSSDSNKSALCALLVGTPAADRPDIVGPNTNSLLLEKLGVSSSNVQGTTHFIQTPKGGQSFMVQSPKASTVLSPLSSPPPQNTNTINVQSLNFAQLQSIPGLQNLQVQLPGFAQPISVSLNVSSAGNIQAHPTSLMVSVPVTTATQTSSITQTAGNSSVGTVNNIAQLVSSGMKGVSQQGIRTSTSAPQTVSIAQGSQPFQLITPLQRPRIQQTTGVQQNLTSRTLQRTPITIKMATPNASQLTDLQLNFDN